MKPPLNESFKVVVRPITETEAMGCCYHDPRLVILDPRQPFYERTDSALHEQFHAVYPEFDEREVECWTKETLTQITPEQKEQYRAMWKTSFGRKVGNLITRLVIHFNETND